MQAPSQWHIQKNPRENNVLVEESGGQNLIFIHKKEASGFQCLLDAGKVDGAHKAMSPI